MVLEKSWYWIYNEAMITQQSQIKINLPLPLKEKIEYRAKRYGLPIAAYVKHLILKDVEPDYPVFEASDRTIKAYKKALKDKPKSKVVKNISQFFKEL